MLGAMSIPEFAPPITAPDAVVATLRRQGYVVADASWVSALCQSTAAELERLVADWQDMPVDPYLKDGGHYRRRRHASFVVEGASCQQVARRPHFQSPEYNALHGGMQRWFEPMRSQLLDHPAWSPLLQGVARVCTELTGVGKWFVEAHQFRIDTSEGIGRPTPEGAHRDGVDFVALFMIDRQRIRGGETRVFDAHGPHGLRFTLGEPWSVLLLDDARMIHESTPIQPLLADARPEPEPGLAAAPGGHRDTLVLTFRGKGFQEP
jgi:hypothetical protein